MNRNFLWLLAVVGAVSISARLPAQSLSFEQQANRITFHVGKVQVAEYVFKDEQITRPYFANLRSAAGVQLTRNHPPVAGQDRMDHPDYHPGVWLAFGDLCGTDNWRLKAPVKHHKFLQPPSLQHGAISWQVENHYLNAQADQTLCTEHASYTLRSTPKGLLLTWDAEFASTQPFSFGDQEEMGLGIRMATPLRVEQAGSDPAPPGTGEMIDNEGRKNAAGIWGKACQWLDYRGTAASKPAGIALFCHPDNPRPTRMHARDYGYVCANPFAIAAFKAGEPATVQVMPGQFFRLRYGLLLHSGQVLSQAQLSESFTSYCTFANQ